MPAAAAQADSRRFGDSSSRARPLRPATSTRQFKGAGGGPPLCTAACCSPLAKATAQLESMSLNRPVLKRGATTPSTHHSTSASSATTDSAQQQSWTGTDGALIQSEDGSASGFPDFGDLVDGNTFEQILEMDDDEDEREFSKSIVYDFFTQAESTFEKMDNNLEKQDLAQLSALGHFLKGSSATLGLTRVKDSCEKIQHFGAQKDVTGTHDEPDKDKCLKNCKDTIAQAKLEFKEVEVQLRRFYRDEGGSTSATVAGSGSAAGGAGAAGGS